MDFRKQIDRVHAQRIAPRRPDRDQDRGEPPRIPAALLENHNPNVISANEIDEYLRDSFPRDVLPQ